MKERSFIEWVIFFVAINLFALGVILFFVPAYPWWFFMGLSIMVAYLAPHFITGKNTGRKNNKYKF